MTLLLRRKTVQIQALKRAEPATARATPTTSRTFLPARNTRYPETPMATAIREARKNLL